MLHAAVVQIRTGYPSATGAPGPPGPSAVLPRSRQHGGVAGEPVRRFRSTSTGARGYRSRGEPVVEARGPGLFGGGDASVGASGATCGVRAARSGGTREARPLVFLARCSRPGVAARRRTPAHALCNIIPPAERSYPSTQGSVTSPIVAPGDEVTLSLDACDPGPGFDANPAANVVTSTFLPRGRSPGRLTVTRASPSRPRTAPPAADHA